MSYYWRWWNQAAQGDVDLNGNLLQFLAAGKAITAGNYELGRNADATNRMEYNVPTGAEHQFSVNGVMHGKMTATAIVQSTNSGSDSVFELEEAGAYRYRLHYDGAQNRLRIGTFDSDGAETAADLIRVPDGQVTIDGNATFDANAFDYVCDSCGRHEANQFQCCGVVQWHDDVALMALLAEERTTALARMEMLGLIRRYEDGYIGMGWIEPLKFTWAGMVQLLRRVEKLESDQRSVRAILGASAAS